MATTVTDRATVSRRVSTSRRDLLVALATVWLAGGLFMDGWAHTHVPALETFFTPWHGVLYSGYAALAISLVPARLWRGRPEGPMRGWVPAGYGLGLLGAILFAVGGLSDMLWHITFGIEVDLEALLSPPHLLLLTAGTLMIATPIRAAAAKRGATGWSLAAEAPVLISATSATGVAAFFLDYLSPFTDAPAAMSGNDNGEALGMAQYLTYSVLVIAAILYAWTRLERVPAGLVTLVVAAASVPNGVFADFENLSAQLWPLLGAVIADVAVQWVAARRPRLVPLGVGVLVPLLVWPTHLVGVELSLGVAWSLELWSGVIVLTMLAGAVLGGLLLPRTRADAG
ncbi:hypothetical protein [Dactylosporangium sp. NPDC048998]|uniref:hypothetical protein n=1 Tax=Dactylosporangium sp. NPDC048998 TaxID=3363976 RepID=UPI003710BCE5